MEHMLSTVDNPFNPFHQYDEWDRWDVVHGYSSMAFIARVINTSDDLSDVDADLVLEQAIDEIVTENVSGMHCKVTSTDQCPRQPALTTS